MAHHTRVHFERDGYKMHTKSEEAEKEIDAQKDAQERWTKEKEARAAESGAAEGDDTAGLRNQFNFSERASQTLNFGSRSIATITEPPASVEYAATANEWSIFDAYVEDMERKRDAERKAKGKGKDGAKGAGIKEEEKKKDEGGDIIHGEGMAAAAKVIERMVNQNTFNEITQDFKFWADYC